MPGARKRWLRTVGAGALAAVIALVIWTAQSRREHRRPGAARAGGHAGRSIPRFTMVPSAPAADQPEPEQQPAERVRQVTLSGRVRDAGGGFIAGAQVGATSYVRLPDDTHEARVFAAESDGEGRYHLQVPRGRHRLRAEADGYAGAAESLNLFSDRVRDFVLQPAARISGRVITAAGRQPIAGVEVLARQADRPRTSSTPSATSDEQGRFVISPLPPGNYRITGRTDGFQGALDQPVELGATEAVEGVELPMLVNATVRGHVSSVDGRGIAHARVTITPLGRSGPFVDPPDWGLTDAEGNYQVGNLMPGKHRLSVSARGQAAHAQPIAVTGDLRHDVVLQDTAVVTGLVLKRNGQPAARAWVRGSVGSTEAGREVSAVTTTDVQGRFSLTGLGGGELTLTASFGDEAGVVGPQPLPFGARKEVTIPLGTGAGVAGVARWEDGSPVVGEAVLTVLNFVEGGRVGVGAHTARDGTFAIRGLPPGEVLLRIDPRGRVTDPVPVTGSGRVTVTLKPKEQRTGVELIVARR